MTILQALIGFTVLAATLTLIPGLDTTLVIRNTVVSGRKQGFAATAGIAAGLLLWGIAAAVGAAALLAASHTAFLIVKYCGVVYLAYIGSKLIIQTFRTATPAYPYADPELSSRSLLATFGQGLWTNLLNPKVGVFYMAMLPQFMPLGVSHLAMGIALAAIHVALNLVWLSLLILVAGKARILLATPRALRIIDRVAGTLMLGFAGKLATTS